MSTHHQVLDAVPPWARRAHARATAHKCERSELARSYRDMLRAQRKAADRRELRDAVREELGR